MASPEVRTVRQRDRNAVWNLRDRAVPGGSLGQGSVFDSLRELWTSACSAAEVHHAIGSCSKACEQLADRVLVMSHRPATVQTTVEVPFPRPRDLSPCGYRQTRQKIFDAMELSSASDCEFVFVTIGLVR